MNERMGFGGRGRTNRAKGITGRKKDGRNAGRAEGRIGEWKTVGFTGVKDYRTLKVEDDDRFEY